jgi:hypothetical protein
MGANMYGLCDRNACQHGPTDQITVVSDVGETQNTLFLCYRHANEHGAHHVNHPRVSLATVSADMLR